MKTFIALSLALVACTSTAEEPGDPQMTPDAGMQPTPPPDAPPMVTCDVPQSVAMVADEGLMFEYDHTVAPPGPSACGLVTFDASSPFAMAFHTVGLNDEEIAAGTRPDGTAWTFGYASEGTLSSNSRSLLDIPEDETVRVILHHVNGRAIGVNFSVKHALRRVTISKLDVLQ